MKITHNKVGQNLNTQDTKADKTGAAGGVKNNSKTSSADSTQAAAEGSQATRVALSPRAQELKKIKEMANSAPDVDMSKVEKFKRLIAEGKYKVDAQAVADKMVDEHVMSAGKSSNE